MPEIKRTNSKALQALAGKLKELEGVQAKTGWFPNAVYQDGTPVAYVAAIQEFGADTGHGMIPPRPFMRTTAAEQKDKWAEIAAQGSREIVKGNATGKDVMDLLGLQSEGDVAKKIASITAPPLSPVTIELRAMQERNPDLKITATTVGIAADRVKRPGYKKPSVSDKPLNHTGLMISTVTHITEQTS